MVARRLISGFFGLAASLMLGACTGASPGADPTATAANKSDNFLENTRIVNTSCYYAPLPGAFRMYCPGPKKGETCGKIPTGAKVSYKTGAGADASAEVRGLTSAELSAMPDQCVAFELNLLPNSDNKLSYKLGRDEYHVFSYLAYGDGVTVP